MALAFSVDAKAGCFEEHLRDAIVLNQKRAPRYRQLGGHWAQVISKSLIFFEQVSRVLYARPVDHKAQSFQVRGISIVCDDFVPMDATPVFRDSFEAPFPSLSAFSPFEHKPFVRAVKMALKNTDYSEIVRLSDQIVSELNLEPRFNCMGRHMLESLRRVAELTPVHKQKSKHLAVDTEALSRQLIRIHLKGLAFGVYLDKLAAPLQAKGLPILCQDVPPIPKWAD